MSVLYSQIVMKQDLGGNIAAEKLTALSQVAVNACDGGELGFVIDLLSCRYDPTKDAGVLCTSEVSTVRDFYRFYLIPGFGHREPVSGKTFVPLPQSAAGRDEMFTALQKWVENGTIPARMDVTSADATASLPLCVYPQKITYLGTGPVKSAANYTCS
jgi:hypothetical protein